MNSSFFSPDSAWRWHGLGMLQRELNETTRVHVWHPSLLRVPEENFRRVHDHRFDLDSLVVYGDVVDERYDVCEVDEKTANTRVWGITHAKMQSGEDVRLLFHARAEMVSTTSYRAGQRYRVPRRAFHASVPRGFAITVVTRSNFDDKDARVLGDVAHSAIAGAHSPIARDAKLVNRVLQLARGNLMERR